MPRRVCFALDLHDDAALIAAYEASHAPGEVPRAVLANVRAKGFLSMEIWRTGPRMLMIAEVTDDWPRALPPDAQATDDAWEEAMDRFQCRLAHAAPGEKWVEMTRLFNLVDEAS